MEEEREREEGEMGQNKAQEVGNLMLLVQRQAMRFIVKGLLISHFDNKKGSLSTETDPSLDLLFSP